MGALVTEWQRTVSALCEAHRLPQLERLERRGPARAAVLDLLSACYGVQYPRELGLDPAALPSPSLSQELCLSLAPLLRTGGAAAVGYVGAVDDAEVSPVGVVTSVLK